MPAIAVVRFLLEKGVALDIALAAGEIAEQTDSTRIPPEKGVAERRRKWDREYRQRKKLQVDSTRIPPESEVALQSAEPELLVPQVKNLSSFSKDSKILTKNPLEDREAPTSVVRVEKSRRGCRLPNDWTPADPDYATEILRDRVTIELEKFRNHWAAEAGAKSVKRDWDAAWRNWVIKASEFAPRSQAAKPLTYFQQQREEMKHALDRLGTRREATAELFPANPGDRAEGLYRSDGSTVFGISRLPRRESN